MSPAPISRRRALGLAGLGVASIAAGTAGWLATAQNPGGPFHAGASGEALREPQILDARAGRLAVALTAAAGARLAGRDTSALGYNGTSPGPTLRVRPGDDLAVRVTNRLDQPTNLHTHDLQISPLGNSDNPFLRIDPGASFDYLFRIPPDHPAGTHWYHPHHHGTVADQVFGGLAGALLVDRGPELPVTADRVLVVTDTTLDADGRIAAAGPMDRMMGRQGELVLVNGQHQPTIAASTGSMERWRIINGCTSRVLALRLPGQPLAQVALDGAFLPAPASTDRLVLAPGNRTDLLIRPDTAGRFQLTTDGYDRGSTAGMTGMGRRGQTATSPASTLATLTVDGPPRQPPPLPASLPAPTPNTAPITTRRRITFAMGMGTGGGMGPGGMGFTIDGRTFDPRRDDQTVQFGRTEEWTITNLSPLAHPFHLHVWPFTVVADSIGTPPTGTHQGVVLVPAQGWVRLRIPFTANPGRSVYHCHILDHEDAGMMSTINVRA
ncbi:multicopper oxidase family protein [Pseudonocardia sp. T1-2H]|uniref:multicopper oxidase family protein n=1 Tax=Pseudonocardia sp. T1-2H TaxID=3128899 RepID=UPI0031016C4F